MFGLFARAPRQTRPSRPWFRPTLERLEARDCPTIIGLSAGVSSTSKTVVFGGTVCDTSNPAGMVIQLTGVATGTAVTGSDGSFSVALPASSLGQETASTPDGAQAVTQLTDPNAPLITFFSSTEYQGGYVMFYGHVNGTVVPGEQITFSGTISCIQGQTTQVNSDGSFNFVFHFPAGTGGSVVASATPDVWGVDNYATDTFDL